MGNTKSTTPLLDHSEHSVQELTPNTPTPSDTIEIKPKRKNFGTITYQSRPTHKELSASSHMSYDQLSKHFEPNQEQEIKTEHGNYTVEMLEEQELNETDREWKKKAEEKKKQEQKKFGTLDGVFGRCLLCIWGVIMYLRTAWVVGNAGIWQSIIIIVLASSVTFLTALSFSAICTNGQVKAGGYYFLISRSLGSEFGGVIGILFYFALCFSISMYLAGFSETVVAQYEENYLVTGSRRWDIVLWMQVTLCGIFLFALRGIGGIVKFDMVLLALLIFSIIVYFIGASGHSTESDAKLESIGFTGYSFSTFSENWNSAYLPKEAFPSVFAVYFPAVTGEMAGANISGDLRDPSFAIPYGTISAIIVSSVVYVAVALSLGGCMVRQVGDSLDHGLYYDSVVMYRIAAWPPFVIVGMLASTLSSAISCFVGAPRIFQKVCEDNLFPKLRYFAKCRKSDNEPVRAYVLTFVITLAANSSGEINILAPLVTNFMLITYAVMNYSTWTWSLTGSPGWRPTFKFYNKWVSLFACFECFTLMFLIDWVMGVITVCIGLLMYKYLEYIDPQVDWGTAAEAHTYVSLLSGLLKYQTRKSHAKVSRPKFLIFNRSVQHVRQMIQFTNLMNQQFKGETMIGDIIIGSAEDRLITNKYVTRVCHKQYLSTDIPPEIMEHSLVQTCIAPNIKQGVRTILETAGVGMIKPNVALFNIVDFSTVADFVSEPQKPPEYIDALQYALFIGMGVVLIATRLYMDWTVQRNGFIDIWWLYDDGGLTVLIPYLLQSHKLWKNCKLRIMALENLGYVEQSELAALMTKLRITCEVISVPTDRKSTHIIDIAARRSTHVTSDRRSTHISGQDKNSKAGQTLFEGMSGRFRSSSKVEGSQKSLLDGVFTYDEEFDMEHKKETKDDPLLSKYAQKKLKKYKKLGKLIETSKDSDLCVVTMPFPRAQYTSYEYMKILQALTPRHINNLIFVRGNQDQVLTFAL